MRRSLFGGLAIVIAGSCAPVAAVEMAASAPPLEDGWYVDHGACPFEGCAYRTWTVERDTMLVDRPRGNSPVGTAPVGSIVEGLTGVVYTRPVPVDVAHPIDFNMFDYAARSVRTVRLDVGDRLYLLTYEGEGFHRVWYDGRPISAETLDMWDVPPSDVGWAFSSCANPSAGCWWRIAPDHRLQAVEWWAQIRLPDGTTGWTSEIGNFGDIDALG